MQVLGRNGLWNKMCKLVRNVSYLLLITYYTVICHPICRICRILFYISLGQPMFFQVVVKSSWLSLHPLENKVCCSGTKAGSQCQQILQQTGSLRSIQANKCKVGGHGMHGYRQRYVAVYVNLAGQRFSVVMIRFNFHV